MSKTCDKMKLIVAKPNISKAIATILELPTEDIIIVCAFIMRLFMPFKEKLTSNYLS